MVTKNKIIAFSLIELIVGITISVLLMVSIGVFVTTGLDKVFKGQETLINAGNVNHFLAFFYDISNRLTDNTLLTHTSELLVFKINKQYNHGGFAYIGVDDINDYYCASDSGILTTKHIFIKTFIPFIEQGESIENFEDIYTSKSLNYKGKSLKSIQKEHKIVDGNGNMIVGKGVFGDKLNEGDNPLDIYLNSPTGIATDNEILYISDTLNDRVIYVKDDKIYTLLDAEDGLSEPTGLYYKNNNGRKELYVSNSGKGEILKIHSPIINPPQNFKIEFKLDKAISSSKISLELINKSKKIDFNSNTKIDNLSFSNYPNHKLSINNGIIELEFKKDITSSGVVIGQEDDIITFNVGDKHSLNISDIGNYIKSGDYYIKLKLGKQLVEYYFFAQGDGEIFTMGDNILEEFNSSKLDYPNGIWDGGYNTFDISSLNNKKLLVDINKDTILETPINGLSVSKDGDMLNIHLQGYSNYNCYDVGENDSKLELYPLKISLK